MGVIVSIFTSIVTGIISSIFVSIIFMNIQNKMQSYNINSSCNSSKYAFNSVCTRSC